VLLSITASIGVAVGGRANAEELMRDADIALYRAKTTGKNRFVVFRPEMRLALQGRVSLENDLRRAIANDELRLLYQPTFELRSGRVIEMEALLRWEHPTRGLLAPAEFIPIAEESGLIVELGTWAIRGACEQAAEWQTHNCNVGISVNVSARQLDDPGLLQAVQAGLRATGIAPASLTLELTETALMRDSSLIATRLQALKHLGVRVAIDDFGTGYSSLAYLHQFPVDALKIDRGFMSTIPKLPETKALIRTLLQLAASLGVDTIAEGIENEAQLRFLISEGCRCGQGFLLSPPMEAHAARSFLDQRAGPANGTAAALTAQPSR
jgi:EAL domain-containing protein (putative c-di-GMP-specific phosphodiesterase class I)